MGIFKKIDNAIIDFEIVILTILAVALLMANIMTLVYEKPNEEVIIQCSRNRRDAKLVQDILAQYYDKYHCYPNSDEFYIIIKQSSDKWLLRKSNCYTNGDKMIRLYKIEIKNGKTKSYKIYFNDDIGTLLKETKFIMTPKTDTNTLFK